MGTSAIFLGISAPVTPEVMGLHVGRLKEEEEAMVIGIMSDSHGRFMAVRRAVSLFDQAGVEFIIHCGDVGGTEVFDELAGRQCRFVWGNTDERSQGLEAYLRTVGIDLPNGVPLQLTVDSKRIVVFHGHEREFARPYETWGADYVFHGHTHVQRDEPCGSVRVINPGALSRATTLTVATLDLGSDRLVFHEVAKLP